MHFQELRKFEYKWIRYKMKTYCHGRQKLSEKSKSLNSIYVTISHFGNKMHLHAFMYYEKKIWKGYTQRC